MLTVFPLPWDEPRRWRPVRPEHLVYTVSDGLVFQHPAGILASIEAERYTRYVPWTPGTWENAAGNLLARTCAWPYPGARLAPARLQALVRGIWQAQAKPRAPEQFDLWWELVNPRVDVRMIGTAAALAAGQVMTYSLFRHRHEIDVVRTLS